MVVNCYIRSSSGIIECKKFEGDIIARFCDLVEDDFSREHK